MKLSNNIELSSKLLKNNYRQNIIIGLLFLLINLYLSLLLLLAIGLKQSSLKTNQANYQEYSQSIDYNKNYGTLNKDELLEIYKVIDQNDIDLLSFGGRYRIDNYSIYVYDYKYLTLDLNAGEPPLNYINTNYIYLETSYQDTYKIDDRFQTSLGDFIVKGFSDDIDMYIVDLNYLYSLNNAISYLTININTKTSNYKTAINLYNDLSKVMSKYDTTFSTISSYSLEPIIKSENVFTIVMISIILFTVLLLVFSILIIGNSVKIAFEKNYKFFMVLLLSGGKKKDVLKIAIYEILMIIFSSFIITTSIILSMNNLLHSVIGKIFNILCNAMIDGLLTIKLAKTLPIYPIVLEYLVFTVLIIIFIIKKLSFIHPDSPISMMRRDLE